MDDNKLATHELEIIRRLAWCVRNGKAPANQHLHLAPGDDENFFYGVPPWNPDGTPNAAGIPCTGQSAKEMEQAKAQRYDPNAGWHCTSCQKWISMMPRKYVGAKEPWDWWFCQECRDTKTKPRKTVLEKELEAKKNHKITEWITDKKRKPP